MQHHSKLAGFTLIEMIVVTAVSVVVFGALLSSFKYSLDLINVSRIKLSALSVGNDRMEYFRSLPYDAVGTVSGIPSGLIPQHSTTTLNGIAFQERVLVEYVDDDADGLGVADSNGIPSDYKRLKLEYTWVMNGQTEKIALISNIVPRSVETTAGGGTVRVNVIDDQSVMLPGASVRLFNNTTTSTIDVTRITDASGAALFSGAPAASEYQIEVTATIAGHDYSMAKTYIATTSNPNPSVAPFSVLESDVSTLTFQIGELSDLDVVSLSAISEGVFREEFISPLTVASSSDVTATGGVMVLQDTAGVYETNGVAYLGPIAPSPLLDWKTVRVAADTPVNTTYRVQFFTGVLPGPFTLIPESDLPGNAVGFTDTLIDISALEGGTYASLFVGVALETTDTSVTPELDEVNVFYRQSETALPNAAFAIRGNKVIGTDMSAHPIYKYNNNLTTDGSGDLTITNLEFDNYTVDFGVYDIAMACPAHPFVQLAGTDSVLEVVLVGAAADTLRVSVVDSLGRKVPGADVRVTRAGYDVTETTDSCGQVFFTGGVTANTDYSIEVSARGYTTNSLSSFEVNGDTVTTVTLSE